MLFRLQLSRFTNALYHGYLLIFWGVGVFSSISGCREERKITLTVQDGALICTLQRTNAMVIYKLIHEEFGQKAEKTGKQRFLLKRLLEQRLEPSNSFEITFRIADNFKKHDQ